MTLADGRRVRSPSDVTHTATASATATVGADWSVGSTLRYGTGAPRTPIVGSETAADGSLRPVYGEPMGARLPTYARADLRVMRFIRTPRALVTTFAEVLNLGNRRNVAALAYDADYASSRPVHSFFAHRTVVLGAEVQWR